MQDIKLNNETLNNIYKNAHIALQSISNVLPEVTDQNMRDELNNQYDGYEKFIGKLSGFMRDRNVEAKDVNVMKKAVLFTSVKMNTLTDDSTSHIADMMIKGTVMGITELRQLISRGQENIDGEILEYAKELLDLEETFEERLKAYL